jgi:hypothetical protein
MVKERLARGTGFVSHSIICTRQASETEEQPGQSRYGAGDGGVASEGQRVSVLSVGVGWVSEQCRRASCVHGVHISQPCPRCNPI